MKGLEQFIAELVASLVSEELAKRPADTGGLVSLERGAARIDMSVRFLRQQIRDGKLPAYKVGSAVRVRVVDIDALAVRIASDGANELRGKVIEIARKGRR